MNDIVTVAAMLCITLFLTTLLILFFRNKMEQQKTLQKLIETSEEPSAVIEKVLQNTNRKMSDLRRGMLLLTVGLTVMLIFFYLGGVAWMFGLLPVVVGLVYLFFWFLNGRA